MRKKIVSFIGPPFSGKSTIIGRILVDLKQVGKRGIEDAQRDAQALGYSSYYSLLVNFELNERLSGHTLGIKFIDVTLGERRLLLLDTPGSIQGLTDVLTALIVSDATVLVLNRSNEKLWAFYNCLLDLLRISQKIVVSSEGSDIREGSSGIIKVLKGTEEGIEEIINFLSTIKERMRLKDILRMPIIGTYGMGNVAYGVITRGKVRVGDEIILTPVYRVGIVSSIEQDQRPLEKAVAGDDIGISFRGIGRQYIKRGYVISAPERLPKKLKEARIEVVWKSSELKEGISIIACIHSAQVPCKIIRKMKDELILKFEREVCAEPYETDIELGTVLLRDHEKPLCIGKILS